MKKSLCAIMILAAMLGIAGCGTKTETKYFLTETVYEFAPDMVNKTVYHYDENWKETGYTEYVNDEVNREVTYSYDEAGNQTMNIVSGDQTGTVRYASAMNEDGTVAKLEMYQDEVLYSTTEYTYDEAGNLSYQCQTNALFGMVSEIWFTADGKILSTQNTGSDGSVSGADYTYDENGLQTGYVNYYTADGLPATTEVAREYNEEGKLVRETTTEYDSDGNVTRSYHSETTYEGNQEFTTSYQEDGQIAIEVTKTYDEAGNLICQESQSAGMDYVVRMTYTWEAVELPAE